MLSTCVHLIDVRVILYWFHYNDVVFDDIGWHHLVVTMFLHVFCPQQSTYGTIFSNILHQSWQNSGFNLTTFYGLATSTSLRTTIQLLSTMSELTPTDIASALQSRGWESSIISSNDISSELVPTKSSGILKCVDGRGGLFFWNLMMLSDICYLD